MLFLHVFFTSFIGVLSKDLYVGGIWNEVPGDPSSYMYGPAALALEDINNKADILTGYDLRIVFKNTTLPANSSLFHVRTALEKLEELLDAKNDPPAMLLLHHGSFTETEVLAEITGKKKMIQISTYSFSPSLSDRIKYPYFYRTIGSLVDTVHVEYAFIRQFGWNQVGILSSTVNIIQATTSALEFLLRENNVDVETFFYHPDRISEAVAQMKARKDLRIIFIHELSLTPENVMEIFCEAYKNGMYGESYVWVVHIQRYTNVWNVVVKAIADRKLTCTPQQILTSMEGTFKTYRMGAQQALEAQSEFLTGISDEEPHQIWDRMKTKPWFLSNVSPIFYQLSYDAVWAAALALNNALPKLPPSVLDNFTYSDLGKVTDILDKELAKMKFYGASGPVSFYEHGSRSSFLSIEQITNGTVGTVGSFDEKTREITWFVEPRSKIWSQHGGAPPKAGLTAESEYRSVSRALRLVYSVIGVAAIIMALILVIFTIVRWNTQLIQNSWPLLNIVIAFGCIILNVSIILSGYDVTDPLCHASLWLFILGFTISYGTMLVKMWGVLRFHQGKTQLTVTEQLCLLIAVMVLVMLDILLLAIWQATDPQRATWAKTEETVDMVTMTRHEVYVATCESDSTTGWSIAFFIYKGIMLLMTIFFVWPAWVASLRTTNGDSSNVGVAMVNVVLFSIVGIPVAILVRDEPDIRYGVIGGFTIISTIAAVLLLLIPKIIAYHRGNIEPTLLSPMRPYVDNLFSDWSDNHKPGEENEHRAKDSGEVMTKNSTDDVKI